MGNEIEIKVDRDTPFPFGKLRPHTFLQKMETRIRKGVGHIGLAIELTIVDQWQLAMAVDSLEYWRDVLLRSTITPEDQRRLEAELQGIQNFLSKIALEPDEVSNVFKPIEKQPEEEKEE